MTDGHGRGWGLVFKPKKNYKGILAALRRLNGAWDQTDMTLILACVSVFAALQEPRLPREIASVIAHRLLAEHLCIRYGLIFQYPNIIKGARERSVVLPAYQVVHAGDSAIRQRSTFGRIDSPQGE